MTGGGRGGGEQRRGEGRMVEMGRQETIKWEGWHKKRQKEEKMMDKKREMSKKGAGTRRLKRTEEERK